MFAQLAGLSVIAVETMATDGFRTLIAHIDFYKIQTKWIIKIDQFDYFLASN